MVQEDNGLCQGSEFMKDKKFLYRDFIITSSSCRSAQHGIVKTFFPIEEEFSSQLKSTLETHPDFVHSYRLSVIYILYLHYT